MSRKGIEDLEIYLLSQKFGELVWNQVNKWDRFCRNSVGLQMVRSADSIAANIAEGYGRYHFKENRQFCYIARGSLFETKAWLTKAVSRNLITREFFDSLQTDLDQLEKKLNGYIRYISRNIKS
jgi:four helix bundle protein